MSRVLLISGSTRLASTNDAVLFCMLEYAETLPGSLNNLWTGPSAVPR